MTQVHVYVSPQIDAVRSWAGAFDGAIDLYRFSSNAEAYERLTAASAPVDVIVLGCDRADGFDLAAAQLAQRLVSRPLDGHPMLANMQIVLVAPSGSVAPSPRIHVVASHEAAVRLVKFGHVEAAPQPAIEAAPAYAAEAPAPTAGEFAGSVISRIWDMADQSAASASTAQPQHGRIAGGGPAPAQPVEAPAGGPRHERVVQAHQARPARTQQPRFAQASRSSGKVTRGENVVAVTDVIPSHIASGPALFAAGAHLAAAQAAIDAMPMPEHLAQAAAEVPVAMPHMQRAEPLDLSHGQLQPAQRWSGASGEYRGPASVRGAGVHPAAIDHAVNQQPQQQLAHHHGQQPAGAAMMPGIAQQMQHMVYPSQSPADPLLGFSASAQQQLGQQPAALTTTVPQMATSPMGGMPAAQPAAAADTPAALMARAESGGVRFG